MFAAFLISVLFALVAPSGAAYAGLCGRDPDTLSFFIPPHGASGLAPAALREWTFVLDPEVHEILMQSGWKMVKSGQVKDESPQSIIAGPADAFLAALNATVWQRLAGQESRTRIPHSLKLRVPNSWSYDRLDFAVLVCLGSPALPDAAYTVELWGVGCRDALTQQRTKAFLASASTASADALLAAGAASPSRLDFSAPSLAPTWVELSAGVERRWLSDCTAEAHGLQLEFLRPSDTGCSRGPAVAFDAWTVRGRVSFPPVVVPWLPALDIAAPPAGLHVASVDTAAGTIDIELFSACTDAEGRVNYSYSSYFLSQMEFLSKIGLKLPEIHDLPEMRDCAPLRGLPPWYAESGCAVPPGLHNVTLFVRAPGDAASTAIFPVVRRGQPEGSHHLGSSGPPDASTRPATVNLVPCYATQQPPLPPPQQQHPAVPEQLGISPGTTGPALEVVLTGVAACAVAVALFRAILLRRRPVRRPSARVVYGVV
jgi:hypothetical protein